QDVCSSDLWTIGSLKSMDCMRLIASSFSLLDITPSLYMNLPSSIQKRVRNLLRESYPPKSTTAMISIPPEIRKYFWETLPEKMASLELNRTIMIGIHKFLKPLTKLPK